MARTSISRGSQNRGKDVSLPDATIRTLRLTYGVFVTRLHS